MIYRFVILSDEVDDFRRDILIDSDATFYDLHEAILDSVGYKKDQMTSFFICDEDWMKEKEITLVEMDTSSEEDNCVMDATRLSDLLDEERQKILYVFEFLTERAFFMELREIVTGKSQPKAQCVKSVGNPPVQMTNFEEFESKLQTSAVHLDDDFYEEDDILNLDEYDEEDFGNLSEGNPFEY
ncbi:MAG: plasmid pRiA4b ORF-3 family protein [Dysgonamonadaceae bacterium]|jgi:hypothetical protein|nr:plasmid pRiA4b ORF-3 family protein [Dysgonamonadaceae bacterium]